MQGRGKREMPDKTRRPAASPGTISTCANLAATPPEIEHGSPWGVGGGGGVATVASALASHQGDQGSIPGGFTLEFSHVRIMLYDAGFLGILPFPSPLHSIAAPSSFHVTSRDDRHLQVPVVNAVTHTQ
ncbi:hypothetical protein PR048_019094 [Dryococelus australis]|uniref:Uncharacterized protein n=1 Tax=Dryococelus australis TaxID=614101 RepID=A0ABQ9H2K0_9NEOP|nr:hypothetical protein PR048_019094 [Dryococelus australis]